MDPGQLLYLLEEIVNIYLITIGPKKSSFPERQLKEEPRKNGTCNRIHEENT